MAVEESVWSSNQTDDVITFLCEVPPKARTKKEMNCIQLLENVKSTQKNWVEYGKNKHLCAKDWLSHNVSNTIHIKYNEWEMVTDYIYENRWYFAGISLLPVDGDKDYTQAPFTTVYTPEEIVKEYGDGSLMASGLVVDGLRAWDNDLWAGCNCLLGIGEDLSIPSFNSDKKELKWKRENNIDEKKDWIRRAKQFSERYFDEDIKKMTYCLKDVYNWKKWCDLKREYKPVDWENFHEMQDNTKVSDTIACAGGKCDI
jgi:ribonucleoside-diphosphate reductase alpha chain